MQKWPKPIENILPFYGRKRRNKFLLESSIHKESLKRKGSSEGDREIIMTNKDDLEEKVDALLKEIKTAELQHEYTEVLQTLQQQYQEMKSEIQRLKEENKKKQEENKTSSSFLQSQSASYIENFLNQIVQKRLLENPHLLNNDEFDEMVGRGGNPGRNFSRNGEERSGSMSYETFLNNSIEAVEIEVTERERKILYGFIAVVEKQVYFPDTQTATLRKSLDDEIKYYVGLLKPAELSSYSQTTAATGIRQSEQKIPPVPLEIQTTPTLARNHLKFSNYVLYIGIASVLTAGAIISGY